MKIREIQYVEDDITDYQERVIGYESWDKYCYDLENGNPTYCMFPSISRRCRIEDFCKNDEDDLIMVTCRFYLPFLRKYIVHIAHIVDDSIMPYVKSNRKDTYKPVIIDSEKNKQIFEKEYGCIFGKEE